MFYPIEKAKGLNDLKDTSIVTPVNGDILTFNGEKWENSQDVWKTMTQNGAHNLLPNMATGGVDNGITFTVNYYNGTVTLSGSVGSDRGYSLIHIYDGTNYEFAGKTIIASGGDAIGQHLFMNLAGFDSGGNNVLDSYVREDNKTVAIPSSTKRLIVYIVISNEYAGSLPQTVYPMFRLASDHNTDYTPYAPTNHDLAYVHDGWKKNGAYNLLCNEAYSRTIGGTVALTVDTNGVIDLNGPLETGIGFNINYHNCSLKKGIYKFIGPENLQYGYSMSVQKNGTSIANLDWHGTSTIFTVDEDLDNLFCGIWLTGGQTFNHWKIYPMITTDLDATIDDFVPYAMTNRNLARKCYYKDVSWRFDATDMKDFLRAITYKVVEVLNQESAGSTVTGTAIWSGYDTCGFIGCKDSSSGIYSLMAWRDNYMYTVRYVPNENYFNAYLYSGTAF